MAVYVYTGRNDLYIYKCQIDAELGWDKASEHLLRKSNNNNADYNSNTDTNNNDDPSKWGTACMSHR